MTYQNIKTHKNNCYRIVLGHRTVLAGAMIATFAFGSIGESFAEIEEIVVTAQKREENLQVTPIAITAITGEAMLDRGLSSLMDVGAFAPNVMMNSSPGGSGSGNNSQIYIRGLGQADFLFTTDPAVGVYIDGVYHPRTLGGNMDLLDLERIEILRGPQGTLFGKNTIGGAINLISSKPNGETNGYAQLTMGKYDRLDVRGTFQFPVIEDQLFAKVSFSSKNRDGYGKRINLETGKLIDRTGSDNEAAARFAMRYVPNEDVTVDFSADYSRVREQSPPVTTLRVDPAGGGPIIAWNTFVGGPAGTPYDERYVSSDPDISYGTGPNGNTLDAWGLDMTVEWDMGWATAKSITAYREMESTFGRDGDGSPLPIAETNQTQDQNQISQEIQFSGSSFNNRLQWVTGGFYFDEFGRDRNNVVLASGLYNALEAAPLGSFGPFGGAGNPANVALDLDFKILNEINITSYAGFFDGTFDVNDRFSITGGVRLTYEKKDYFLNHVRVVSGVPILPSTTVSNNWTAVTYRGIANFQATEDMMVYASISNGFKSGGFNGRPTTAGALGSYDPEYVLAYEGGLKADWLGNRLRTNVAVFYNDYTDIQLTALSTDDSGLLIFLVTNAGEARSFGAELEVEAEPIDGLNIQASLGYLDFKYTNISPAAAVRGLTLQNKLPRTPKITSSLSIEYSIPVQDRGFVTVRGDWTYTAENFLRVGNAPEVKQRAHSIFNARIAYEDVDNGWEIAVFATNITDVRVLNSGQTARTSFGTTEGVFNRPQEWGLSVKKRF